MVSQSLAELIETRMGSLPEPVREVVDLLVFGEPLPVSVLGRLTDPAVVEQAEMYGVVSVSGEDGCLQARLAHPLYGEVRRRRTGRLRAGHLCRRLASALGAVDECSTDVLRRAVLMLDATEGVTGQDQRLAERVDAAGCPILVVFNKWELITDPDERLDKLADLSRKLAFIGDAPVLKVSALTGKGVHRLRPALQEAIEQYHRRVPTRDVNKVLADAQQRQPAGGGAKVLYAVQGASDPPTFTLFVNRELPQHHLRFLERSIRDAFGFGSTPIKLRVRKKQG